ncbi:MAG: TetR/AcrR family transcriptional regulator [Hyphomonas sp.]|nr:TetR/AcrR family transcriptional regulator [Hyphomonas sp.]
MDTRTALLDSAERAARQRGFDAFSYADLARDVGIRKASIHHHFPKKADLALDLLERYAAAFMDTLAQMEATDISAADKLSAYLDLYRDAVDGGTQVCLCVAFSAGRANLPDPVLQRLNQFHEDSVEWLTRVLTEAGRDGSMSGLNDPAAEAHATLALMEGAQLLSRAAGEITPFDTATASFRCRLSPQKNTRSPR